MAKKSYDGAGSMTVLPNGTWEGRISLGYNPMTGKRIRKCFYGKTRAEVRRKMSEAKQIADAGIIDMEANPTLGEWLDKWYAIYTADLSYHTKLDYNNAINRHLKPLLGDKRLKTLTAMDIQGAYSKLIRKGLSPKTIKNIHSVLHSAIKAATMPPKAIVQYNVSDYVKLPKVISKPVQVLSHDHIKFLMDVKNDTHYPMWIVYLFGGLREAELCGLTLDDIDFDRKCITVNKQAARVADEVGQKTTLQVVPTKNKKGRAVYAPELVFDVLQDWLPKRAKMLADYGNHSDFVFANPKTGMPYHPSSIYHYFKRHLAAYGLPEDTTIHGLRHTCATLLAESGVDMKTIQMTLGHHSAAFTMERYAHSTEQMQADGAGKLGQLIDEI